MQPDGQNHAVLPVRPRRHAGAFAVLREMARSRALLWMAALMAIPAVARAQTGQWQVGTASSFSTGRYETETPTSVIYTPTTARRLFADGDVTLVFPFTCIKGDAGVTVVSGSPVRTERGSGLSGDRTDRSDAGDGSTRAGTADAAPVSACGMGDIVVRGRYYLVDERAWIPTIAVRAHLKAPTASARRGLGTGRPDEGIGVEVSRFVSPSVMVMVDGGYTVIGKPTGASYQNTWWYDAGVSRDLANGRVNLSVFFEAYQGILPGSATARDILASVMLRGTTGWRVQVSGQFGLSDGAPDQGLMIGASRRF